MKRSIQRQLPRERVEIFLELFTNGEPPRKQLPFKLAILAPLSGDPNPKKPIDSFRQRRFIDITEETFDKVMQEIGPHLFLRFDQPLAEKGPQTVALDFFGIEDFRPEKIAEKVFAAQVQERQRLSELQTRAYSNPTLAAFLLQMATNAELLQRVLAEVHRHEEAKKETLALGDASHTQKALTTKEVTQ